MRISRRTDAFTILQNGSPSLFKVLTTVVVRLLLCFKGTFLSADAFKLLGQQIFKLIADEIENKIRADAGHLTTEMIGDDEPAEEEA